ncbi:MAG: sulfatase/phosphatase domain-containing protein [Bryobacteraceae bacterium]
MLTRRAWLFAPLALAAQSTRPRVSILWTTSGIPADFAAQSLVFPRAYTCCPDRTEAAWALEHGRFPHAARASDSGLWEYFERGSDLTIMTSDSADGMDSAFDRSIRVPLAIRWPGRIVPRVANDILLSHADLLPTILSLAGIKPVSMLQGRDLSGLIETGVGELPESVYIEGSLGTREEWRAVVRGFEKLTWNLRDEITGLYNLADDPGEATNLYEPREQREHRLMRDSLHALGHQWMERLQDGRDAYGLRTRRP